MAFHSDRLELLEHVEGLGLMDGDGNSSRHTTLCMH